MTEAMVVTEVRKNLFNLVKKVSEDHDTIEIVTKGSNAILMSKADYDSMMTTMHILSSPKDAERLRRSIAQADAAATHSRELIED